MLVIKNETKRVLVFKSDKRKPLRIFPRQNNTGLTLKEFQDDYLKDNAAATAMYEKHCSIVSDSEINKKQADNAKVKNDKLNVAHRLAPTVKAKASTTSDTKETPIPASNTKENPSTTSDTKETPSTTSDTKETPPPYKKDGGS